MRLLSRGPEETVAFGKRLGNLLKRGDTIRLFGGLGSGKTTFIKGIASALGIPERNITSASFTIIAEYEGTLRGCKLPFYHIDLYRIGHAAELDSIGLEGYFGKDGISVVEWAERLGEAEDSISVTFEVLNGEGREIRIEGIDEENWNHL